MLASPTPTGRGFERTVADYYRTMGAVVVEHDREVGGNQIDVYVEMECPDRSRLRLAIETKEWGEGVGVKVVNAFATVAGLLRQRGFIDAGIIVSEHGFTRQARQSAAAHHIRLLEISDLQAMANTSASSSSDSHLGSTTVVDVAREGPSALRAGSIGWRLLGSLGGTISGLVLGAVAGLTFSQLLAGATIGMLAGAVHGAIRGPRSWLLVSSGVDIGFLGALIGAAMAVSTTIWTFAASGDGAFLGGVVGLVVGWLFRNRVVELIDGLIAEPLMRSVARITLGPAVGVLTGALLGYGLVATINTGKIVNTMPLIAAMYGSVSGLLLSIVLAWSLCQAIQGLHSLFVEVGMRIQRS